MKVLLKKGESLSEALRKQNIRLNLPCGGKGICGGCMVEVEQFGKVRSCQFRIPGTYEVTVPKSIEFQAVGLTEDEISSDSFLAEEGWDSRPVIAVDLGTTTVAMTGFYEGRQLASGFTNPQRRYGADVMSRLCQANDGKQEELTEAIRSELCSSIRKMTDDLCKSCREVSVVIAGNTTMLHFLFGLDCKGLGRAPFLPSTLEKVEEVWKLTNEDGGTISCNVTALPGISAFVGADIVSGIYALSIHRRTANVLFVDLGTNGEMVLAHGGILYTASAAAGPAFEGNELAAELFGAGILKCLHKMLQEGAVDSTGMLSEAYFKKGFPVSAEDKGTLYFTQDIIREIQMAKAAIRAGIEVLLKEAKIDARQVDEVLLAGGMGFFINPADAVGIGMLPEDFLHKTKAVGNTSLLGAIRYGKENRRHADMEIESVRKRAKEIVLADDPDFSGRYIDAMNF